MKNKPIEIYAKLTPERHEAVFSGIKFSDFIECTPIPVENILSPFLICVGGKSHRRFKLLEGRDDIAKLLRRDIYNFGDFGFVDYADTASICQLTEEQLAELLYLMHMFKPLKSQFFDVLQNNYAYLSHDDGWYCKLYCKEQQALLTLLINKVLKSVQQKLGNTISSLPHDLVENIAMLSLQGLLIQLHVSEGRNKAVTIKLYEVGEYEDMNALFNHFESDSPPVSYEVQLQQNIKTLTDPWYFRFFRSKRN